jgi:DNA primase
MIPQSFIQDLLHRTDVVDVIEQVVPLKRAGSNFSARCPFHNEKSPSFTVSPSKQFYHCFGCGAHGTAISFMMEYHGMEFLEAVKDLADRAGMKLPTPEPRDATFKPAADHDLSEYTLKTAQYYKGQLKQTPRAVDYLKGRGLTGEVAARYGLGYAPDGWQNLEAVFTDYSHKALVDSGLVIVIEEGRRYDRFRDRIMFPIHNQRGVVIGFGGRVLGNGEPKYLNSPETPLFEKGRELYGLFQARQAIRDAGCVLVVEGYMDVVALSQFGVGYAVATLGTATTPFHVQKLLRQSDRVVFCFDGDAAGQRAAWRALENSLPHLQDGKELRFLFLPTEHDPDSYVREFGKEKFEAEVSRAQPLSEFLLNTLSTRVDMRTAEGRAHFLQDAKPLVKQITAPMFSLIVRQELAKLGGLSLHELDTRFGIQSVSRPAARPRARGNTPPSIVRRLNELLLIRPELVQSANLETLESNSDLTLSDVPSTELELLATLLRLSRESGLTPGSMEFFRGHTLEPYFHAAQTVALTWDEGVLDGAALEEDFLGAWDQLVNRFREARLDALSRKAGQSGWTAEDMQLYRELQQRPPRVAK